ncbi:Transcription factor [Coemansia sp. RSA 1813]|nr:Transcription factor [Coemansia sp. RSA 1646]KAJ1768153.1 Transcription factor [Coemansia sp. RSA 1843]KAJ2093371.1 Transcription factor [Coemansia sp. RSA 986]KAJ2217180.1 Transcription factor [Coemansia sp. RSA 487]KAJ2572378.1 Transcription factor [Coemansia sp. RSA 1813]
MNDSNTPQPEMPVSGSPGNTSTQQTPLSVYSEQPSIFSVGSPEEQQPNGQKQVAGGNKNKGKGKSGTASAVTRASRVTKKKGELLSENEKKANHIASEQKRRQNIRVGYDQLIQIVPTLTPSQRSEALILQKTVEYIKYLLMEREILDGQLNDANSSSNNNNNR